MRMKLVIGLFAVSSLALPLLAQAPHAVAVPPPVAPHASAPSAQHPASTLKPASHSSVAVHHSTSTSNSGATHSASGVKVRALDFDNLGSAPLGPHFVGPVSPGGFVNPLAAPADEVN